MSVHYNVSIDTGGTFTDCIATDSEGKIYRKKILSNGTLRGQALALVSENSLKIKESWFLSKDILAGYQLYSLDQSFESKVISYDFEEKILTLDLPVPSDLIGKTLRSLLLKKRQYWVQDSLLKQPYTRLFLPSNCV
jgi:5-oxoprolinase (ATP-hydrolysing)